MLALGAMMVTAQVLYLQANLRGEASLIAPFWYMVLVWAGLYDALVFDVWPDIVSITGCVVIVAGGLLMTWREIRARQLAARRGRLPEPVAGVTPAP